MHKGVISCCFVNHIPLLQSRKFLILEKDILCINCMRIEREREREREREQFWNIIKNFIPRYRSENIFFGSLK